MSTCVMPYQGANTKWSPKKWNIQVSFLICKDVSTVYMVKGRHPQLDTEFHDWSEFIPYSFAANFDPNATTDVPTEGGLMASEIFAPETLYSSVIHKFEYHLAIHFRTLAGILSSSSG